MKNIFNFVRLLILFTLFIIASWFIIHIFSVFGIFLAVAYPIWWILAPKFTICLLCRSRKQGQFCPLCRRPLEKEGEVAPKTFLSAVLNSCMILIFTLVSIGVVFLESQVLFKMGFPPTPKTVSFIVPRHQEYQLGKVFKMDIAIRGMKEPINTVRMDIAFDPHTLEIVDVSTKDSFATIFIQKNIDNKGGYAQLTGGLPNPGYSGGQALFATVYLRGIKPGVTTIKFLPSSIVLANNGRGDNVLKGLDDVSYLILPHKTVETKPNEKNSAKLNILGASTNNTQMIFYDEKQVLGASTEQEFHEQKKADEVNPLLNSVGRFDTFILILWSKILRMP